MTDAPITLLPQIWFRNLWSFGLMDSRPTIHNKKTNNGYGEVTLQHPELGEYYYYYESPSHTLFTENETNNEKLWQSENKSAFVKDLFHTAVVNDTIDEYKDNKSGTKFSPMFQQIVKAKNSIEIRVRISKTAFEKNPLLKTFEKTFTERINGS